MNAQGGGLDYEALAAGSEQMRESCAIMVAGFVADGFTDREARTIVAGWFGSLVGGKVGDE